MTANRLALAGFSGIPRRLIHCLNTHRVRYEIIHEPEEPDRSLAKSPDIVFAAGTTTDWIKLAGGSYLEIVKPVFGRFLLTATRQASKL
jgi:hypothetical protein